MNKTEKLDSVSNTCSNTGFIKTALWWLRNYESVIFFWTGFSWACVTGIILFSVIGNYDIGHALLLILLCGIAANAGIYLTIKTLGEYLKQLKDGPEKKEAHELMTKIIVRRLK